MAIFKITNKIGRIASYAKSRVKIYVCRDAFLKAHIRWVKDKGDETHRLIYDLNETSIVFDLGGYEGDFTKEIHERYRSSVFVFEPVSTFHQRISYRFEQNKKISVFNFGLSNRDETRPINLSDDGSSIFGKSSDSEMIQLKDIVSFIKDSNIDHIDLMKINIEGGEFQVVPALIESGLINKVSNLQIQFHLFVNGSKTLRKEIREKLTETHELTYDYWFIWENWRIKKRHDC